MPRSARAVVWRSLAALPRERAEEEAALKMGAVPIYYLFHIIRAQDYADCLDSGADVGYGVRVGAVAGAAAFLADRFRGRCAARGLEALVAPGVAAGGIANYEFCNSVPQ